MEQESIRELRRPTNGSERSLGVVMTEHELREISKSVNRLVLNVESRSKEISSFHELQQLIDSVLRAASSTNLSVPHGGAAIGALCGLLHRCSTSSREEVKAFVLDASVWTGAVEIYLTRAQFHKPKPLRRLLMTVTLMLTIQEDHLIKQILLERAVSTCLEAVYDQDNSVSVKPAIQLLEHFLNQRIITARSIIILASSHFPQPRSKGVLKKSLSDTQIKYEAKSLLLMILKWIQYPDCAPAINGFLPLFLASIESDVADNLISLEAAKGATFGVDLVKEFLEEHPNSLESMENHILPNLLHLDRQITQAFLNTIPHNNMQNICLHSCSESDLQLCLLAVRVGLKLGVCKGLQARQSLDSLHR